MANKVILNIQGDTTDIDRSFLEAWYREVNPLDYSYDLMKYELSRTNIKDLTELYIDNELAEKGLPVSYELQRDLEDPDVAENLMSEIRYMCEDLLWMIPREDLIKFLDSLIVSKIKKIC